MRLILIDPSPTELEARLRLAVTEANGRCRERLVVPPTGLLAFESAEGAWWADGGGVANKYGYSASSSAIGYAWWTATSGRKHILIVGRRMQTSGRHVTCVFGPNMGRRHPKDIIYPSGEPCLVASSV